MRQKIFPSASLNPVLLAVDAIPSLGLQVQLVRAGDVRGGQRAAPSCGTSMNNGIAVLSLVDNLCSVDNMILVRATPTDHDRATAAPDRVTVPEQPARLDRHAGRARALAARKARCSCVPSTASRGRTSRSPRQRLRRSCGPAPSA